MEESAAFPVLQLSGQLMVLNSPVTGRVQSSANTL
jgi:hypothetical protein